MYKTLNELLLQEPQDICKVVTKILSVIGIDCNHYNEDNNDIYMSLKAFSAAESVHICKFISKVVTQNNEEQVSAMISCQL